MRSSCKKMITHQVSEFIRTEIEEGNYGPGIKIPPAEKLAELFGVQEQIVRTAVDILVKEGLLERISDLEFSVLGRKIERNMEKLEGFTQTMLDRHINPSFRIISRYLRQAGNKYGSMFGIKPEEPVFYIKRACYGDEEPVSLEEIYIPFYLIPKIEGLDLNVFSIYEIYGIYGIQPARAEQTLDLVRPGLSDAKILGLEIGMPAMLFRSVTYDTEGRTVEFNRNYVRGDKCSFHVLFSG